METIDDRFVIESGQFDLTLMVDGYAVQVSKIVLCIASPVFRAMLELNFKEKGQTELDLPGKNYRDFVEFLNCIYPDRLQSITSATVYGILPLAVEYQVQVLMERCETCLIEIVRHEHRSDGTEIYRHIQLATFYKLGNLEKKCIYIASEMKLIELEEAASKHLISTEVLVQIHRTACRRHEIDKQDDQYIIKRTTKNQTFLEMIKIECGQCLGNEIQRLRLCYRYFPNEVGMLEEAVKKLQTDLNTFIDKKELDILPELIKQKLEF